VRRTDIHTDVATEQVYPGPIPVGTTKLQFPLGTIPSMANRIHCIFALVLLAFPSLVAGYGVESETSLEWNLANADRVVRGYVISVRYEERQEIVWQVCAVRVAETLKGPAPIN
jgi:hypothetical protein